MYFITQTGSGEFPLDEKSSLNGAKKPLGAELKWSVFMSPPVASAYFQIAGFACLPTV